MKRSFILLPFILLLLSCNNDEDTEFAIPYSEEFELPATFGIEYPVSIELISISTESDDRFLENETTASLLNSARISTAQITISGSTGDDFEFVDQGCVFLARKQIRYTEDTQKNSWEQFFSDGIVGEAHHLPRLIWAFLAGKKLGVVFSPATDSSKGPKVSSYLNDISRGK